MKLLIPVGNPVIWKHLQFKEAQLTFQVFAKEDCIICRKAQDILTRLDVDPQIRYVEGTKATPENVADFAWYDWSDKMPLVVVTEGDQVLRRWSGANIEGRWLPEVKEWLADHGHPAGGAHS